MLSKVTSFILMASMYLAIISTEVAGGPGEWTIISPTDPEVQKAAAKAKQHIDEARNSAMVYILQEVTSAEIQIVKGKNYRLALKLGETNCFRTPTVDVKNCSVVKIVKVEPCVVTVWVWQDKRTVTNFTCGYDKNAYQEGDEEVYGVTTPSPDGEFDLEVSNENVIRAATFAAEEMTRRSKGRHRIQFKRAVKATIQALVGARFRLTLEVTVTSSGDKKGKKDTCKVKVWEQEGRTPRYILEEYKCNQLTL